MIRTITEKARAMMIHSQARIQFWGEAVNTAVYLHQRSPNEGLKRNNDHDGYQAPYETPYEMRHGFGKPTHDAEGNKISYQASLHNLRRFRCYASRLFPEVQRCQGKFGPRSKPCMMVGYTHYSKTLWRIWDPEFQKVKAQSEVIFDEERNAHMLCQHGSNENDMFGLPEDEEYVNEKDTGDEPLRDSQPMQIGKRSTSHMQEAPDKEAENIAHSRRIRREDQTAQRWAADAENITHSRRLRREDQTAQRSAADGENIAPSRRLRREAQTARRSSTEMKKSSQVPPASPAPAPLIGSRVTRSQGKASAEALTASEAIGDPFTYAEAMLNPQRDHWKRAVEEESTSILLNNTFSALNSREAWQLQVKPIGSKWVYKTKHNPDGSTRYKARLVIKRYEQTDFSETYAPVGKICTFRYLISLIGRYGWNMDNLDVVTAFLNPEIDDDDIYMTLPEGWPEGLNPTKIIVRLRKALYGLKEAPRLRHDDINAFQLSLGFTQSSANSNLYLRSDGILILLYVDDISMSCPEAATKAAIQVKAILSDKYKIKNLGPARQFLGIEIYRHEIGTGISLGQKAYITTILRRFGMDHSHGVSMPMDPNVKLDLPEDRGEKELEQEDITDYQAVVGSLMYAALGTWPNILYAVAALSRYNSRPFTSHITAAKRVLQHLKSTADFRLHVTGNGIDIGNSLVGYSDSDWANDSADRKSQGGHVFLANNGAVSWQSRKEGLIGLSTLEAAFITCSEASREAIWLLHLQKDIHSSQRDSPPLPINCDNQGTLTLITTGIIKARTKHIDVCYHNSRDLHKRRIVNYSYLHTNENVADILTKALTKDKHTKFTKAMGLW
jgi:hypothetical protein